MGKNERRRRVRVVYRSLQYYFLAQFFIYSAIIVFFLAVFLFVPDMLKMQNENLSVSERTSAADRVITLHVKVWPAALALIALLGLHSFCQDHCIDSALSLIKCAKAAWLIRLKYAGGISCTLKKKR
jgi:uncharacterized membrane protein